MDSKAQQILSGIIGHWGMLFNELSMIFDVSENDPEPRVGFDATPVSHGLRRTYRLSQWNAVLPVGNHIFGGIESTAFLCASSVPCNGSCFHAVLVIRFFSLGTVQFPLISSRIALAVGALLLPLAYFELFSTFSACGECIVRYSQMEKLQ